MRGAALAVALLVAACNEPTGPSRKQAVGTCANVGAVLALLEVGGTASPQQREPVAAKHTAACEAAKLTLEERECVARATNTWAAIDCAPRMFPKATQPGSKSSCVPVVARIRAAYVADLPPSFRTEGSEAAAMIDRKMQIAETLCIEDAWPPSYLSCVMASKVGDLSSLLECHPLLTMPLADKLQAQWAAVPFSPGRPDLPPAGSAAPPATGSGSSATP